MREKFKKKFYEFKKLLFHRNTAPFVLAEPLQLYNKSLFHSFCSAKLQRALVLLFNRCSNARVLAEPLQLYTNAHSAAFATQNCSEHLFYCFTGVPTPGCSQNPSSYTPMPIPQLLQRKTAASTRFTVSQVFQRQGARRSPRYTPMPIPQLLQRKTAASTRFTVSPEYRTFRARIPRTPQVAKSMLR